MPRTTRFAVSLCALLAACSSEDVQPAPDGGPEIDRTDLCNSAAQAKSEPTCKLTLDQPKEGYIAPKGDVDWYSLDITTLPPRAMLTVRAEYKAPASPVTLIVNVLGPDGVKSIGSAFDLKPRGLPSPVEVLAGPKVAGIYYVVVKHDDSIDEPASDSKNPYTLLATIKSDPDVNEPNDTTPTPLTPPACGTFASPTGASGFLSTQGDVDKFKFTVPASACGGRTIVYLKIDAPTPSSKNIVLGYQLDGPSGTLVRDRAPGSPAEAQSATTAWPAPQGDYVLSVFAFQLASVPGVPAGDPAFAYTVTMALLRDEDANEGSNGNDVIANATSTGLSGPGSRTFTGRLSYVTDLDTYKIDPGSSSSHRRVQYALRYSAGPGRFAPLFTLKPRELNVFTQYGSAQACLSDCPDADNPDTLSAAWCNAKQLCLLHHRKEISPYEVEALELPQGTGPFDNFEGQFRLPAGDSGPWYLQFGFEGGEGGDDIDYTLSLTFKDDTSASNGSSGSATGVGLSMGSTATRDVDITYGYGNGVTYDRARNDLGLLPRHWVDDYDSAMDTDYFDYTFTNTGSPPPPPPDGGYGPDASLPPDTRDVALRLSWRIPPGAGQSAGERSFDLSFRFWFCRDSSCSSSGGGPIGYTSGANLWTEEILHLGSVDPVDFDQSTGTFTVKDLACLCIDGEYAASGRFRVQARADNRRSYTDSAATLTVGVGDYAATGCPTPCKFIATIF